MSDTTMLIAYDGSEEAHRALIYAAKLLKPKTVEIITAWEPLHRQIAFSTPLSTLEPTGTDKEDPAFIAGSKICQQGVELAQSLGLTAKAHLIESETAIWSAIVDAAVELKPDVIVSGTRGISGWKSLWQSSTADNLLHHAEIPVFVVPPMPE